MFHDESWKSIYFGVNKSKVKFTGHINIAGMGLCTLVRAGFFEFIAVFNRITQKSKRYV